MSNSSVIYINFHISFGPVPDVFAMDNVQCQGNEIHITECQHLTTEENCGGTEGAGVKCTNEIPGMETNNFYRISNYYAIL